MSKADNARSKTNAEKPLRSKLRDATEAFDEAVSGETLRRAKYIFRLYITGSTSRSLRAVYNLKKLCEEYLPNDYDLEVIDIYKNPAAAREEQIVAAPTLVKQLPRPIRKFVGDLSNTQKILVGLDIYKHQDFKDQLNNA